jgi:anti-sigma factor RsiW
MQKDKKCRAVSRHVVDFMNRELPEATFREVELHLERCAACRKEAEEIGTVAEMVCSAIPEPSPALVMLPGREKTRNARFADRQKASLRETLRWAMLHPIPTYRVVLMVSALLAVILALVLLQRPQQNKPQFENVNVRKQFSHIEPNRVPADLRFPSPTDNNGKKASGHDKNTSETP